MDYILVFTIMFFCMYGFMSFLNDIMPDDDYVCKKKCKCKRK